MSRFLRDSQILVCCKFMVLYFPCLCVVQGVMVLMMGSKEEDVPVEPTEKPSFIEDMTEAERNTAVSTVCVWLAYCFGGQA